VSEQRFEPTAFSCKPVCLPFDLQHQQQVALAVDRAKQITMAELNAVMQVKHFEPHRLQTSYVIKLCY
jgi:hypothetical protein